jgi:hypothetical protein
MENRAIDICERNELWALIKRVSDYYGGDEIEFLKAFGKNMVKICTINKSLTCFRELATSCQTKVAVRKVKISARENWQELQPPFLRV